MKHLHGLAFILIVLLSCRPLAAQRLSMSLNSGINVSDIHGNIEAGKWVFNPGPVQNLTLKYSITSNISLSTGLGMSSVYYNFKRPRSGYYPWPPYYYPAYSSYYDPRYIAPYYYNYDDDYTYQLLTMPLMAGLTLPGKPSLSVSAGIYNSFVTAKNLPSMNFMAKTNHDFGFIYSTSLSIPFTKEIDAVFSTNYLSGRKSFIKDMQLKHGRTEITLGLSYHGFGSGKKNTPVKADTSSTSSRINILYLTGMNLSWNKVDSYRGSYHPVTGLSLGFLVDMKLGPKSSFRTGTLFERTGYAMRDSSDLFYRDNGSARPLYKVNSTVRIDYLSIPALVNLYFGKNNRVYFNTGPYYAIRLNGLVTGKALSMYQSSGTYNVTETKIYDDIERMIRPGDWGWIAGGGVSLPVGKGYSLLVGAQYRVGFREIFDKKGSGEAQDPYQNAKIMRNELVSIHIGIKVPVK